METLIVGAGMGGVAAALALRERLGPEHRIRLIDRSDAFAVGAAQTWVMTGAARAEEVVASRSAGLSGRGIDHLQATVTRIEPSARRVETSAGAFQADFLVVALGADLRMDRVPGLAEAAETFYTLEGAARLADRVRGFRNGRIVLLIPRTPYKCPPAPYEAALVLRAMLGARVELQLYTVEPAPMATAGPTMGQLLREELARAAIGYFPAHPVKAVEAERREVLFESGARAAYDLLIAVPPHEVPPLVREAGLAAEGGWIAVDPATLKTRFDRVWAVGDVAAVPLPGRFKPEVALSLPKAGVFAAAQARVVAAQIAAEIAGGGRAPPFDGSGYCFLETGEGRAVKAVGGFFATPHPLVAPDGPPGAPQLAAKREWVRRWLAFDPP